MGLAFVKAQLCLKHTVTETCDCAEGAICISTEPSPVALADVAVPCVGLHYLSAGSSVPTAVTVPQGQQNTEMASCNRAAACQAALPQPMAGPAQMSGPPAEAVCADRANVQQPQPCAAIEVVSCNEATPTTPGGCQPCRQVACPLASLTSTSMCPSW